jgi:branched-chain amino acid transport system ATP-binding protein
MKQILDVKKMTMDFGGVRALNRLDLDIKEGEIAALIGPNGAGKTTFFNCITGIYKPTNGEILVTAPDKATVNINKLELSNKLFMKAFKMASKFIKPLKYFQPYKTLAPHIVTEIGMARTFQNIRLFQNMTVLENIMIGRHCRTKSGVMGALLRVSSTRIEEKKIVHDSYELLKTVNLENQANEIAKNLPYGDQRRLEIARAMATEPFLLLLDEPAAGMNPQETINLVNLINKIRDEFNISILLIEHDMKLVMTLSDRIFVMEYGKKIAQGTPEEIKNNPVVIKAYLGEDIDA